MLETCQNFQVIVQRPLYQVDILGEHDVRVRLSVGVRTGRYSCRGAGSVPKTISKVIRTQEIAVYLHSPTRCL